MIMSSGDLLEQRINLMLTLMLPKALVLLMLTTTVSGEIENGLIRHIKQISYRQCVSECNKRNHCLSARFRRQSSLCYLFRHNLTVIIEDNDRLYHKNDGADCTVLAETCIVDGPESCCQPRSIPGSKILGNIPTIGAKLKYKCLYQPGFEISECLTDGSWSMVNLTCACGDVRDIQNIPVENVIWSRTEDQTSVSATASCKEGFTPTDASTMTATCDGSTGQWSGLGDICCERLVNGDWTKIYSLPSTAITGNLATSWYGVNTQTQYCQYRNGSFIDNWPADRISIVRLEFWKDETIVAWANFSATSTDKTSWFKPDKHLASSWSEQSGQWIPDTYTMEIASSKRQHSIRFYIGESSLTDNQYPNGLMVVTKADLISDTIPYLGKTYIIYSKNGSYVPLSGRAETSSAGFADRLEVWVKWIN